MFTLIMNGSTIVYDPRIPATAIRSPAVHLAVNEPGSVSFQLDPDHLAWSAMTLLSGVLELSEDSVVLYRGRAIKISEDFNKIRAVETEGMLGCLNDSVIPPFTFPDDWVDDHDYQTAASSGNVVAFLLGWMLDRHNAQVTAEQQIHLGTVTVTDPNNFITRSSTDYMATWSAIKEKLADGSLGGYLLPRYESDGTYLDYLAELPLTNTQKVTFGGNLLDISNSMDGAAVYSVILPIGADGLTLEELPDGAIDTDLVKSGLLIYSTSRVAQFGKITKQVKWDDVTDAANLRRKAAATLAQEGLLRSITVKACDLHCEGEHSFRVGRNTRLTSTPHGISAVYPLMSLDIDILNPAGTTITLGAAAVTLAVTLKESNAKTREQIEHAQHEIRSVERETSQQITQVLQSAQAIMMQALEEYVKTSDLATYQKTVSTTFEQTAENITIKFNQAMTETARVDNDLQTKYNERMQYIRFEEGKIILGEAGNELTLTIENDQIVFRQNGHDVAWFQYNKFHVTDAEIVDNFKIGAFGLVPGVGGNLSLLKVGD